MDEGRRYEGFRRRADRRVRVGEDGFDSFVGREEGSRGGQGGYDDAGDALVDAPEHVGVEAGVGAIAIELCIVWTLETGLDRVERVWEVSVSTEL